MASTNKTTNYELSQFQSSDIPAWLTDYNGDMQKIDAGIHAAKTQADGAASGVSILQTAVSGKQDRLDFDTAPIAGSTNPVTSGGIYNALQNAQIQTDAVPTEGSTKAVQSGGVYTALLGKQNKLTFDSVPTQGSANPVTSGGVYTALNQSSPEHVVIIVPIGADVTDNYLTPITSTYEYLIDLPESIVSGNDYILEFDIYGLCDVSATTPSSLASIRLKNNGENASALVNIPANMNVKFPSFTKHVFSQRGIYHLTQGNTLSNGDIVFGNNVGVESNLLYPTLLPNANQLSFRVNYSGSSDRYVGAVVLKYRKV